MSGEWDELWKRSEELGADLGSAEALEVNAALFAIDPGHSVVTNRLGIGLNKNGRPEEARDVFEVGLRVHPDNKIMQARLEEAEKMIAGLIGPGSTKQTGKKGRLVIGWTDYEPQELVESSLRGPGRDASIRMCAASILEAEKIDQTRTAVTPIKSGHRFRTIGGIFTGVGLWQDTLTVAVPASSRALIADIEEVGGYTFEPAKAVPCVQVAIPRGCVDDFHERLVPAHIEHLKLSIAFGPPTHLNKHSPALRKYILDQAAQL